MHTAQDTSTHQQNSATARGRDMIPFNLLACLLGLLVVKETKSSPGKTAQSGNCLHHSCLTYFLQHESHSNGICKQSPAYAFSQAESTKLLVAESSVTSTALCH